MKTMSNYRIEFLLADFKDMHPDYLVSFKEAYELGIQSIYTEVMFMEYQRHGNGD